MIIVTVTLVSAVDGKATTLGIMSITNTGENANPRQGDYRGEILRKPDFTAVTRSGTVRNWRRLDWTIWQLVQRMLNTLYGPVSNTELRQKN